MPILSVPGPRVYWLMGGALAGAVVAAALLALPRGVPVPPAGAQEVRVPEAAGITVVGDGVARAQPNTTTIRLGVEVTAASPAEALSQTLQRTEQVLQRLREAGLPEADLQTSGLHVSPIHGPSPAGPHGPGAVTGYRGSSTVTGVVPDIGQVGPLLTAALAAGASSVQGLNFGLRDDSALRRQALITAIADARPKAEAIAAATGLVIAGVRSVVEQPTGPVHLPAGHGGGGEGIAPGDLNVPVRVQVTFDVTR